MKNSSGIRLSGCLLLLAVVFLMGMPSTSQAQLSLKLNKLQIFETAAPGGTVEGSVLIINEHHQPLKVAISLGDFDFEGANQKILHIPFGTMPNSCARWIRLGFSYAEIPAKSNQALQYIITLPQEGLEHAEYMANIYVETMEAPRDLATSFAIGARARMSVAVKIGIQGLLKPSGRVTGFKILPAEEGNPMRIQYAFENTGNTLHRVSGSFVIMDDAGGLYGRGTLSHGFAKPGETITISTLWDGDLDPGTYDLITDMRHEPDVVDIHEVSFTIP